MFSSAESPEAINAYHQERLRQIDRAARELEVEKLLKTADRGQDADPNQIPRRGLLATIAGKLRRSGRMQQLPGS